MIVEKTGTQNFNMFPTKLFKTEDTAYSMGRAIGEELASCFVPKTEMSQLLKGFSQGSQNQTLLKEALGEKKIGDLSFVKKMLSGGQFEIFANLGRGNLLKVNLIKENLYVYVTNTENKIIVDVELFSDLRKIQIKNEIKKRLEELHLLQVA